MKHEESSFIGTKDYKIYFQKWIPDNPKAVVQIVHGFAEHSGRYMNVVNTLIPEGYAIFANDHRGHGKSDGQRNYVDNFEQFVEDEKILLGIIKKEHPNLPIFMLGHSMGSMIAIYFTKQYESELKGLILSGVGTDIGGDVGGFIRFVGKLISKIAPTLPVAVGDLSQYLSHDPQVVEAYNNDPYVYAKKTTARLGAELLRVFPSIKEFVGDFKLPLLIQVGSEDKLALNNTDAISYFKMEDKTARVYKDLYHEVYNELEKDRTIVLNDLKDWLNKHIK